MAGVREDETDSPLVAELVQIFLRASTRHGFLADVAEALLQGFGAEVAGLVRQRGGQWEAEIWRGSGPAGAAAESPPEERISDAIDRQQLHIEDRWCIAPLAIFGGEADSEEALDLSTAALVVGLRRGAGDGKRADAGARLLAAAAFVAAGLWQTEIRDRQARRIAELQRVLAAAATWQRLEDDDELLRAIADTACELLECERASIFLWDRRRGKLIGRPALGVAEDSLEVDDAVGVVGEVLQTAESRIWNAGSDEEGRINRSVDRITEFQTRSLVAVPMHVAHRVTPAAGFEAVPPREPLIGVFEALNRADPAQPEAGFEPHHAVLLRDLATHAAAAIESLRTRQSLTESRDRLVDDAAQATQVIGEHRSMKEVRATAKKVAGTDLILLVLGENGTGKEVLARHIHFESQRRHGPFVAVNCAALVESLLESELFGHEKGAFTDAHQTHAGKFELANGGTLFLDEVGDMSPGGQAKLLRVLEEKIVVRVGGSQPIPVDVRVIAATNQPLQALVTERRFREDLFFRLNVVSMTLPPLRDRGDDILRLAEHFLDQFCQQIGRRVPTLSREARQALMEHPWPGNIRELRNTIERVCYLTAGDTILADDLTLTDPASGRREGSGRAEPRDDVTVLTEATRQFQIAHIDRAIEACQGNMTDAAERLGLHRSNLYRKMRQLGMEEGAGEED